MTKMEECLDYFMKAVTDPLSVPPWSEWWAANVDTVEAIFPLFDYVRLKHRRLLGAQQILIRSGQLPENFCPPSPHISGTCNKCGERTTNHSAGPGVGSITCPNCGEVCLYDGARS